MTDRRVREVLDALEASLRARVVPTGFSSRALARLLDRGTEFLEELGFEAIRVAGRAGNDEVQPADVDRADEIVRSDTNRGRRALEAFGGLVWGLAAMTFVQETIAKHPRMWLIGLAGLSWVFATIVLTYSLAVPGSRTLARRRPRLVASASRASRRIVVR
jgi:hypothetical protein